MVGVLPLRRANVLVTLAGLAVSLAACGRVSYDMVNDGDAGPRTDASPGEDGGWVTDGATATDGSQPLDGAPEDGTTVVDAGPTLDDTSCDDVHAGAAFCDGYEDASLASWDYPIEENGAATHTTEQVYRGTGALRCETTSSSGTKAARYSVAALRGVTSGDVWFRAYYYLPSSVVVDGSISLVALAESRSPYDGAHLRIRAGALDLEMEVAGVVGSGATSLPRDRWVCVELRMTVHDVSGVLEGYVEGALAVRAEPVDTRPARGITLAEVGIHDADPAQGPAVLFVDEVVVDTVRVGCD